MNQPPPEDRNFDDLASRFARNIYNTQKGGLRLQILRRDFHEYLPSGRLRVLDVGGGQGQLALELATQGHQVLLTDVSSKMLAEAAQATGRAPLAASGGTLECRQLSIYALESLNLPAFDLVMCHAVLEWLAEPEQGFQALLPMVRPGGLLSLVVYNINGLIMKNLLRGNYQKIIAKQFRGAPGSLTPSHPVSPDQMVSQIENAGLRVECYSGIRVFNDYQLDKQLRESRQQQVLDLELALSRQEPFRALGRYLHFLCRRPI